MGGTFLNIGGGGGASNWEELEGKPSTFPSDWNTTANKPNLFDGTWASLTGKPNLFSGSYTDLSDKPSTFPSDWNSMANKPNLFDGTWASLTGKPNLFSGSYNDLSDKPTLITGVKGDNESTYRTGQVNITKENIGLGNVEDKSSATILSELTSSNVTTALGFTPTKFNGAYSSLTGKPTIPSGNNLVYYGTCSTAADVAAKTVTVGVPSGTAFSLKEGTIVCVFFTNGNTVGAPTLNVNSTGAYKINVNACGSSKPKWVNSDNSCCLFYYAGSEWLELSPQSLQNITVHGKASFSGSIERTTSTNVSVGSGSIISGRNNDDYRTCSNIILGDSNTANGSYNLVLGSYNTIGPEYTRSGTLTTNMMATTLGFGLSTNDMQVSIGHYNNGELSQKGYYTGTLGTAFVIGNGTGSNVGVVTTTSNACRITYTGQVIGKSAYASTGADYAEYFEWIDGNPDEEDRRGYFVALDGDKIKKAKAGDFILGIVSGHPCVIGNFDECYSKQFEMDEFGDYIYVDEDGNPCKGGAYKVNPDYDPEQKYIPREDRPEWDAIGMMGRLRVHDDGTCEVNGYCVCNDEGKATKADKGYRVLKRINDHIVEVLFSMYANY